MHNFATISLWIYEINFVWNKDNTAALILEININFLVCISNSRRQTYKGPEQLGRRCRSWTSPLSSSAHFVVGVEGIARQLIALVPCRGSWCSPSHQSQYMSCIRSVRSVRSVRKSSGAYTRPRSIVLVTTLGNDSGTIKFYSY